MQDVRVKTFGEIRVEKSFHTRDLCFRVAWRKLVMYKKQRRNEDGYGHDGQVGNEGLF